jgi:BirA family biotin operon repressor/biotin-[acetyl-CoA-carboxylase] ligase
MIGERVIELDNIDSTNAYASQVFRSAEFEDGTVVWAHNQYAGRGQHDHSWISESGKNLTCTICLHPRFLPPDRQFQLNKAIALGAVDFLRHYLYIPESGQTNPEISIKWPNDLYAGNQKIGGILIENSIMGAILETSLAGIGVNINQTRFAPDIPNPVSFIHILRHETMLKDALLSLCRFLDHRYSVLKQTDTDVYDLEFDQNLLGFGQWRTFSSGGELLEGKIRGVDLAGRLKVENREGKTLLFYHKEIEYIL